MSEDSDREKEHQLWKEAHDRMQRFLARYGVGVAEGTAESDRNAISLITIVSMHRMLEVLREEGDLGSYLSALRRIRHELLLKVWAEDLLDSPWRALVDEEFPGEAPTTRNFEVYAAAVLDQILGNEQRRQIQRETFETFVAILIENEYDFTGDDLAVAMKAAGIYLLMRTRSPEPSDEQRAECYSMCREAIDDEASNPSHSAWQKILEYCYPPLGN